ERGRSEVRGRFGRHFGLLRRAGRRGSVRHRMACSGRKTRLFAVRSGRGVRGPGGQLVQFERRSFARPAPSAGRGWLSRGTTERFEKSAACGAAVEGKQATCFVEQKDRRVRVRFGLPEEGESLLVVALPVAGEAREPQLSGAFRRRGGALAFARRCLGHTCRVFGA